MLDTCASECVRFIPGSNKRQCQASASDEQAELHCYSLNEYRCLRQNRRVVTDEARRDEIEEFHTILSDISWGIASDVVQKFIAQAYVRGAVVGNAENCELESSTAVFTKRRYRDRWNRIIVRRVAGTHNHTLKIKARIRAKGVRGQQYYSESKTSWIRKRARTQNLWLLQLAGDWHPSHEVKTPHTRPHLMRCMLVSNLTVDQRFANGTQG